MTVFPDIVTNKETTETQPPITFEQFLVSFAGERAEWVNGKVIKFMPIKTIHQKIVGFLSALLQYFAENLDWGQVFMGPMQIRLDKSAREPDIFCIAKSDLPRITEDFFAGPPSLIIEVISEDSVSRDRVDKFEEYEDAKVPEYWIIDPRPQRRRADFYILGSDGKYQPVPLTAEGVYRSTVLPGFWLNVNWLWAEPLPKLMPTLKEITG